MRELHDRLDATPRWPNIEALCAGLAERGAGRVDMFVDAAVSAIRANVPAYACLPPDAVARVRHAIDRSVRLFLVTLAENRAMTREELSLFEEIGEDQAAVGVSLAALRTAVGVANTVGYDHLHAEAAAMLAEQPDLDSPVDVTSVSRHLSLHAQEFYVSQWSALEAGHRRHAAIPLAGDNSSFLERLLVGATQADRTLDDAAADAELAVQGPCLLVVLVPSAGSVGNLRDRVGRFDSVVPGGVISRTRPEPCPHVVVLIPLGDARWRDVAHAIAACVDDAQLVAIAEPVAALATVASTYRGLRRTLTVASRLRPQVMRVLDLGRVWAASLLSPEERFVQVRAALGGVLSRRRDYATKAIDTLLALHDHGGSVREAARELGVSEDAIYSRLDGIKSRTDLRWDNVRDLATLAWAVTLYWFDPESLPPPGDPAWKQEG